MAEPTAGRVVVVGTGHGGVQTGNALRRAGWVGPITLVGAEPHLPYQRPPLSKSCADAEALDDLALFHPAAHYDSLGVDLELGAQVVGIDRDGSEVELYSGRRLAYDHLVLALGSRPRPVPVAGCGLAGVHTLRTLDDARWISARLRTASSVVLVGGGFIGLELATVAARLGKRVTVVEAAPRLLHGAVTPVTGQFLTERHTAAGVRLRLGEAVDRITGVDGAVRSVLTASGDELSADLVVVGVGAVPNCELARAAGLPVDDGILVDYDLVTADPAISAIGDCARFPYGNRRVRLSSVQNAFDGATHVARRLTSGAGGYAPVPWFWSDQAGVKVQMAGLPAALHGGLGSGPEEQLDVEGDVAGGSFSVHRYVDGRFVGGESVGMPRAHLAMRRRLAAERASPVPLAG
jgi:3-phenylpropionate/trans-cinnamate dioxygenase ferredoxin reductase subunit